MGKSRGPRSRDPSQQEQDTPAAAWWRGSVIAGIALAMALGGLVILWLLARPLTLLLIAVVIAQALTPVVALVERKLPRNIAIILVYAVLVGIVASIGWLVVPPLVAEGEELLLNGPELQAQFQEWLRNIEPDSANRVTDAMQSALVRFSDVVLSLPFAIFSSVIDVLLVVFMSLYWLLATPALHRFTRSLFPPDQRRRFDDVLAGMGQTMGGYVRATAINGVIIAVMTYTGLRIIGVDYPLVLAAIAGLGELLPVIGPIFAAIPAISVALIESPQQAIVVTVFYILLQQLEANLLVPYIMKKHADVPPLLSLFALLAGSTLGGPLGAIIAIPVAGGLRVLVLKVLAPAEREWTGADEPEPVTGTADTTRNDRAAVAARPSSTS